MSFALDYIKDMNEVRAGFRAQTFGHLLKSGSIKTSDVNVN